jgi:hypothetical protein
VVDAARRICAALEAPSRPEAARAAVLLARADVGAALAPPLLLRAREPRAAALSAVASLLRALTLQPGEAEGGVGGMPHGTLPCAASLLAVMFAEAGGIVPLSRLLLRDAAARDAAVLLVRARPTLLDDALLEALIAAACCRYDAAATGRGLASLTAAVEAAALPLLPAAALPLLVALLAHDGSPALRGHAARTLSALLTADESQQPQNAPTPPLADDLAARLTLSERGAVRAAPLLAEDAVVMLVLRKLIHADADDVPPFTHLLSTGLLAGCADGPPPLAVVRQLTWLVTCGDAARRARGAFPARDRALALGASARQVLAALLTGAPPACSAVVCGCVFEHPQSTLLHTLLDAESRAAGDTLTAASAAIPQIYQAFSAAEAYEASGQPLARGAAKARLSASLASRALSAADAAAHDAAATAAARAARMRAQLARLAMHAVATEEPSDDDEDADADAGGGAPARAPPPRVGAALLLLLAQNGFDVLNASAPLAHAGEGRGAARGVTVAHTVGLHLMTSFPELLVTCEHVKHPLASEGVVDPSVSHPSAHPLVDPFVALALCQCVARAGAAACLAAADAAQDDDDADVDADGDADGDGDVAPAAACTLDAPLRGAAGRFAREGFTLAERDARVLPALWEFVGMGTTGGPPGGPPPPEVVDALTWHFAPCAGAGAAPSPYDGVFDLDLASPAGGAGAVGLLCLLHARASASWARRIDPATCRLHRLPALRCDVTAAVAACAPLAAALRAAAPAAQAAATAAADCNACALCTMNRDVGAACALPGCKRIFRLEAGVDDDDAGPRRSLLQCSACVRAAYCGAPHAAADWRRHKRECRAAAAEHAAAEAAAGAGAGQAAGQQGNGGKKGKQRR